MVKGCYYNRPIVYAVMDNAYLTFGDDGIMPLNYSSGGIIALYWSSYISMHACSSYDYLILINERSEAVSFIVWIESKSLPSPAAVHPMGAQKVVQTGYKCSRGLAQVHRIQLQVRLRNDILKSPEYLMQFSPTLK